MNGDVPAGVRVTVFFGGEGEKDSYNPRRTNPGNPNRPTVVRVWVDGSDLGVKSPLRTNFSRRVSSTRFGSLHGLNLHEMVYRTAASK